jgi:energy-coupling factor transporter transmembrane protein EcfT
MHQTRTITRAAVARSAQAYDGRTHYAQVLIALTPAFLILLAATFLMLAIL